MQITRNYDVITLTDAEVAQAIGEWVMRKREDLGLKAVPLRMTTLKDVGGEPVPIVYYYDAHRNINLTTASVQIDRPIPVED